MIFIFYVVETFSNIWLTQGDDFKALLISIIILVFTILCSVLLSLFKFKNKSIKKLTKKVKKALIKKNA